MTEEEIFKKLSIDRPDIVINKIISFKYNKYGFYDVEVDMEGKFFDTVVKHVIMTLPCPQSDFDKLSDEEKFNWRF